MAHIAGSEAKLAKRSALGLLGQKVPLIASVLMMYNIRTPIRLARRFEVLHRRNYNAGVPPAPYVH